MMDRRAHGVEQRFHAGKRLGRRAHHEERFATLGVSGQPSDCFFCQLVREGDHVKKGDGFVAIRDINPKAETHLLVLPERHVDTFRDVAEFTEEEAKRMLEFVADTARGAGLEDYRVLVNVGPGGGQTIFHLHWHVLGGRIRGMPA